jgi:hypothetical protein
MLKTASVLNGHGGIRKAGVGPEFKPVLRQQRQLSKISRGQ